MAIFCLVESATVVTKRQIKPEFKKMMGSHYDYVSSLFVNIYVENSVSQRLKFFSDPLVQFLWSKFRSQGREIFNQVFKNLNDDTSGDSANQKSARDKGLSRKAGKVKSSAAEFMAVDDGQQ